MPYSKKVQLGQRAALYAHAWTERAGYDVVEVVRETESGMKANRSRANREGATA
ncbi:hypothetical protein [Sphingomonas sp. PP-CC-3G-468]|uniref:hypothetical protein n=1 Tax=Sphingomonas sp. PP-CC-3G-468 TaxID=2135656 RepID=UPI0010F2FB92|nr:hypothetical protein [Sphingomonas sp. PP-CC-3G-468]TCM07115.1 hypothetical protein C8J41_10316 [Sphingomonas sp. PP-CC-3G-468]